MTSIFVAKLDFGVTSEQLKSTFEQYGKVLKASVATDRETGKSRGFAFVEMEDATEARNAISALDNYQFNGRPMTVKEAEPRENKPFNRDSNFKPNKDRDSNLRPSNYQNQTDRKPFQKSEPTRINTQILTPEDFAKLAAQSSEKPKKSDKKKKGGSMEAYRKSGKTPRYDLDDDMDDWRPSSGRKSNIQFEEDDDEDY